MVLRQRVWIDRQVQGVLVGRVVLYWSGIMLYSGVSIGIYQWQQNPDWSIAEHLQAMFEQLWPCLPTVILLLPLVIFDIVRLSNRFAGPVYRLRMHLARLREDSNTYPLNFRDDDYWQQLAGPINELQQRILTLEKQVQTLTAFDQQPAAVQSPTPVPTPTTPTERPAGGSEPLPPLFPTASDSFVQAGV